MRGHRFEVRGITGIVANLHRKNSDILTAIQRATRRASRETKRLARQVCPVRTGRMRDSITDEVTPQALGFSVFYDPDVFVRDAQPYYPVYVELGTALMPARPTLRWAFDIMGPIYEADVRAAIRGEL